KKQNLFTFTSSELPMMRIGPNDEWIRCGIFIIAKNTIFPSKRNECSIKTFFYSMTSDEVEAIQEERFIEEMMEEQSQLKDYELKMKIYNKVHTKEILQYNHFNTFQNQR
ncbi:MAG: hypothetical protein ABI597_14265, partial [Gammaproteobacteria bacterium]